MSGSQGFFFLLLFAFLLIVMGFQGSLGTTIAILFSPAHVTITE